MRLLCSPSNVGLSKLPLPVLLPDVAAAFSRSSAIPSRPHVSSPRCFDLYEHHQLRPLPCRSKLKALEETGQESFVETLTVPETWLLPPNALQESEWLRASLHKWLDDEYCPEPANVEISKVAAQSYYKSLLEGETDLGEILLRMVKALESVSFQESFHGVFSSANAAVHLITLRMESSGQN